MNQEVSFAPVGTQQWRTGRLSDLSDSGLFIGANTFYPPQTALQIVMTIPGERFPVRLSGEVSWARSGDPAGMFVVFSESIPAEQPARERISRHIAGATRPASPKIT